MAQPLYFLPGVYRQHFIDGAGRLSPALLRDRGLEAAFGDVGPQQYFASDGRGPDNVSGLLLCYQTPSGDLPHLTTYVPHEQTWHRVRENLWIGVHNAHPPRPEDLARRRQFRGYLADLADDLRVQIPIIRRYDGTTELPCDAYWDAAGEFRQPIKEAYLRYWEASDEIGRWFFGDQSGACDKPRFLKLAIDALSLNYRYSVVEHAVLRWIDLQNFLLVLAWSVDAPGFKALDDAEQKKTSWSAAPSTTPGPMDG